MGFRVLLNDCHFCMIMLVVINHLKITTAASLRLIFFLPLISQFLLNSILYLFYLICSSDIIFKIYTIFIVFVLKTSAWASMGLPAGCEEGMDSIQYGRSGTLLSTIALQHLVGLCMLYFICILIAVLCHYCYANNCVCDFYYYRRCRRILRWLALVLSLKWW